MLATRSRRSGACLLLVAAFLAAFVLACGDSRLESRGAGAPSSRGSSGDLGTSASNADPSANSGLGSPGEPQASNDILGRKVIRSGNLELEVQSVAEAYDRVSAIAVSVGGYVQEGAFTGASTSRPETTGAPRVERSARLVLRVPADRYDQAVASLRAVAADVRGITVGTQDVTGEVADLDATLANLRAVEAQYVQLMGRAQAINDVLTVQEKLRGVRLEIDRTQARLALTTRLSELATITVQLLPVAAPAPAQAPQGPLAGAAMAWAASLDLLRVTTTAVVMVLVFSWWLLPLLGTGAFLVARLRRRRQPVAAAGV